MILSTIKGKIKNLLSNIVSPPADFVPYKKHFTIRNTSFDFWIVDKTGQQWYDHDYWNETVEFEMLNRMISSGDHVMEFGLHHGFFSTFITKKIGDKGKFIGIELLPKAAIYAMSNLKLNDIGSDSRVINAAGGDKPGTVTFSDEEGGNGFILSEREGVCIDQVTGDSLLAAIDNRIDCIKIDVEGFEVKVLEGCSTLLKQVPNIALEIHIDSIKSYGDNVFRIFELIDMDKYNAYYFWNPGTNYMNPTSHRIMEFSKDVMGHSGIINLFLFSKR